METTEKLNNSLHIYDLINRVNREIIREKNKDSLFSKICNLAVQSGIFKIAFIGLFDFKNKITLDHQSGIPTEVINLFSIVDKPQKTVLQTGTYYLCNNIKTASEFSPLQNIISIVNIKSCIVLPVRQSGAIIGTLNLYATEIGFYEKEEIDLLVYLSGDISFALDQFIIERKHKENEEFSFETEKYFRHTLDNMLEGVQIQDFNFRYLYLNDTAVKHSNFSREELLGYTMPEKYPGIEHTNLFKTMQNCMSNRISARLTNEFTYPDSSKGYFDISIQPIPEGLYVLSVDISEQIKANEKLRKANRLYSFLSAINKSIVHIDNEDVLFDNACQVALNIGGFNMGWISLIDENNILSIRKFCGDESEARKILNFSGLDINNPLYKNTPALKVIKTGRQSFNNNLQNDPELANWKEEFIRQGIYAAISMPIKKYGEVVGIFGLFSGIENFFDEDETALLEEAAGDISFAIENLENKRKHIKAEELIIQNEIKFRALIEKSADMKTLSEADGTIIYSSPSVEKVLGYQKESLMFTSLFDIIHPDDVKEFTKNRKKIAEVNGASFSFQQRRRHKNGNWIWCEGTITNLLHEPGIQAMVANFRDISAKILAEQQREFDKNNFIALINNTKDLMWSIDRDYKLITSNKPFNDLVKLVSGNWIYNGINMLETGLPEKRVERYKNLYQRAFKGEVFMETEFTTSSGTATWAEISFYPIRNGKEIIGAACHSRDITGRKKVEEQLLNKNKELEKTNSELDRFVYSVSHDLRSPLTSVMGLASLIESEGKEENILGYNKMIQTSVNRLDQFIKNILSYSRNNRIEIDIRKINVKNNINEIIEALCNIKEASGITFELNIDEQQAFFSDEQRFNTIIENIISNAIKYHKHGQSENKFIKVSCKVDVENLHLSIEDNGVGIAPEYHEKIFQMFFRLQGKMAGSGIGLYIVKEIIEKLKGTIKVISKESVGTTFIITLKNMISENNK